MSSERTATTYPPRALLEVYCTVRSCLAFGLPRLVGLVRVGSGTYRHESSREADCPVCGAPLGQFPAAVTT